MAVAGNVAVYVHLKYPSIAHLDKTKHTVQEMEAHAGKKMNLKPVVDIQDIAAEYT